MHVLIIGYGSIGARHARLFAEHGHDVVCVTGNPDCPFPVLSSVAEAVAAHPLELVIISNATVRHHDTLSELLATGYAGKILVEKPLYETGHATVDADLDAIFVAYNLRFHPLVQRAHELLQGREINSAQFYVGQYLPDWRPGTDYRKGYSAIKEQGGGVLRDLSHELDLVLWMLGKWTRVSAIGGQFSALEISSDDIFALLLATERCPVVSVHLDYLNHGVRRGFNIITEGMTLCGDFVAGTLTVNGEVETFKAERDTTYIAQLEAITGTGASHLCTYEEGETVMQLIDAAEGAAQQGVWIQAS